MAETQKKFFRQIGFLDSRQREVADVVETKEESTSIYIDLADRASEVADVLDSAAQKILKK